MLSRRVKQAIRTSVAVVIAYAIALHMDWEKPYWAAWTAFSIGFATTSEGVRKGLMRLAGGLLGAVGGFVLLAFFVQDRWLFITFLSLYGAVFTYLALGSKHSGYFWQQAGFFATVIAFDSAFNPSNAFQVGIERAQETGTGLVTFIVVALLLWPENSRRPLEETTARLVSKVRQMWDTCTALLRGAEDVRGTYELRDQLRALQARVGTLLGAAESDSWEVAEVHSAWRSFQAQIGELSETLVRWHSDLDESQARTLVRLAPGLSASIGEIGRRLAGIEQMMAGKMPTNLPEPIAFELDEQQLASLSHFDGAAVATQHSRLQHIDVVTRALFGSACAIRGIECSGGKMDQPPARPAINLPVGRFSLDRDHLDEAIRTAASIWLMFLVIVYVPDAPASLGALGIATRLAFADSAMPSFHLARLFVPVTLAMSCAFPFYVFVMPRLSSFPELAVAVSVVVFAVVYLFHEPRQVLLRTIFAYIFFSVIGVTNEQGYSFTHFSTTFMMWLFVLSVLTVTEYLPVSHQPDRVFLRLLRRFLRSCEFILRLGRMPRHDQSIAQRLEARFHAYEVSTLPAKLTQWARSLPTAALGASTPEQLQSYVNRLWGLSYRMQALLEARALDQSTALVRELRPDMRAWRMGVESILRSMAVEPESAAYEDLQSRLLATFSKLETRIEEALNKTAAGNLSAEESENMYRLLSAHRGVSESLVQLTKPSAEIDWYRLREARF